MIILNELLILALWCKAIDLATRDGMILHGVDRWAGHVLPEWLYKPVIGCVYCMASVHGTLIHLFFWRVFGADLALWPVVCVCGIAVNGLVSETYELIKKYNE